MKCPSEFFITVTKAKMCFIENNNQPLILFIVYKFESWMSIFCDLKRLFLYFCLKILYTIITDLLDNIIKPQKAFKP